MQNKPFITIEGIDGSGKTTIINYVCDYLREKKYKVYKTREPGGSTTGEEIRKILLNKNLRPLTEATLFSASRIENIYETIEPKIKDGFIVISDRYIDSSIAYQGFGRELGVDKILELNSFALDNKVPDLTIVLDVDYEKGQERINKSLRLKNRLDKQESLFYKRCIKGYNQLPKIFPERNIKYVDGNNSLGYVKEEVKKVIKEFLNEF